MQKARSLGPALQSMGSVAGALTGAVANRNTAPWLALAMGPTKQDQFRGFMGGIEYGDRANRQESQFAQTMDQRQSQFDQQMGLQRDRFQLLSQKYREDRLEREAAEARDGQVNAFLSQQLAAKGVTRSPAEIALMRSDPTLRKSLNRDLELSGGFDPEAEAPNLPKYLADQFDDAKSARNSIEVLGRAEQLLDQGITTGSLAGVRNEVNRFAQLVGAPELPNANVANTDEYVSIMARQTAEIITNFGAGTGLSDADRQYAQKAAGGDIRMDEAALRNLLSIARKSATARLSDWDGTVSQLERVNPFYGTTLRLRPTDLRQPEAPSPVISYEEYFR